MRILQLTEAFAGGVFTSLTRLASGLASRGHEVHLAYARREHTPIDVAEFVPPTVHLHELALVRPIAPQADLAGFVEIRRLMRLIRPDIIHLHSSKAGVLGRMAAWSAGDSARMFYSPRGLSFLQEDYSARARLAFERIEWLMARLGGTVVACSAGEEALIRSRLRPRRVALVENAVDVEAVTPHVERDDGLVKIGIVGRITYARNSALFADLAKQHGSDRVRFQWVGGGDGADRARLEAAGVEVTGWMPRPEALAAMSRLDIYLHPSRWEGMPVALIESQLAALPAVATDVIGNRDVVRHGETGFLGGNPDALSASLATLIGDASLRRRIGETARHAALNRFGLDRMIDEYERLYAGVPRRREPTRAGAV